METSNYVRIFENVAVQFKSYYVVWKHIRAVGVWLENDSLNRTM